MIVSISFAKAKRKMKQILRLKRLLIRMAAAFGFLMALVFFCAVSIAAGADLQYLSRSSEDYFKYTANAPKRKIEDEAHARAYALSFLESRYVQCADAQNAAITFENGEWTVASHAPAKENQPLLRFDENGVISLFDHTFSIGQTRPSDNPYDNSVMDARRRETWNFTYQFADVMLPGISYESGGSVSDVTDGKGRYVSFPTGNTLTLNAHRFVMQVEPVLKVMAFELIAEKGLSVYTLSQTPLPGQSVGDTLTDYVIGLETEKGPFLAWSLEDKACLSMQMPVLYAQYKEKLGNYTLIDEVTSHAHGIPDDAAIAQEDALKIAQDVLEQDFAVDMDDLSHFQTYYGFYMDDSSAPVWEVIFAARTVPQYIVTIASRTGEVISLYGTNQGQIIKELLGASGRQSVPKEGAIALAQNALTTYLGMSSDEVAGMKIVKADRIEDDSLWAMRGINRPFWVIRFAMGDGMNYSILLDAQTGMILVVLEPGTIGEG